jgi:enoyl-[acyl-carrier protein] reductase I
MTFLNNKRILISGLLSNRSIAYGVAEACSKLGANLAFSYQEERFKKRVFDLAKNFSSDFCFQCDVSKDHEIEELPKKLLGRWKSIDGFVHAIAFAPREAISGSFIDGLSRSGFSTAHEVSSYSFGAMTKSIFPIMNKESSAVTISYAGAERFVPGYNTMALAKASLEASVKYLANDLGPKGIRVNGVSAGPIKTLAASGIKGFSSILNKVEQNSPLKRNVTPEEIGNVVAFLISDLSRSITGEIIHADNGFNTLLIT